MFLTMWLLSSKVDRELTVHKQFDGLNECKIKLPAYFRTIAVQLKITPFFLLFLTFLLSPSHASSEFN